MILPEGNSKKYIKVVIGIYVLFTIVSPIITKISGKEIQVSDIIDLDEYIEEAKTASETQNQMEIQNEDNILDIYVSGIKEDMKAKIEGKGYVVNNININVANDGSYEIQKVVLELELEQKTNTHFSTENANAKSTEQKLKNNENAENAGNTGNTESIESVENIESIEAINKVDVNISMSNTENSNNSNANNNENSDDDDNNNKQNELSIMQKQELKEYISSVYEIKENNITIN